MMAGEFPVPLKYFADFRRAYQEADHQGAEKFVFHGHAILTQYAKHVVEYEEPYAIAKGYIKN